jgi:hypothetical protein
LEIAIPFRVRRKVEDAGNQGSGDAQGVEAAVAATTVVYMFYDGCEVEEHQLVGPDGLLLNVL